MQSGRDVERAKLVEALETWRRNPPPLMTMPVSASVRPLAGQLIETSRPSPRLRTRLACGFARLLGVTAQFWD